MKFTIITHVEHKLKGEDYFAYAPYVREMNLWLTHVDEAEVIAPKVNGKTTNIDEFYKHPNLKFRTIPSIQFTSLRSAFFSFFKIPFILFSIFKACSNSDHIHLRCPGNIGLLGCFVQILFPKKIKTAKYAGNWDPKSKQPISYKVQKWILSNIFLTKNINVLVYGDWKDQTKNIKPFFTASFKNEEREKPAARVYKNDLSFIFVGSLVKGKRPLFAINVIEGLRANGVNASLKLYGDGVMKNEIESYIQEKKITDFVTLKGNQTIKVLKEALRKVHFVILPSKSEGWPKALAEAMFYGAIPVATKISCVPYMLDYGNRGILIDVDVETSIQEIIEQTSNEDRLKQMSKLAMDWSQQYTLDTFEQEIVKLLNKK